MAIILPNNQSLALPTRRSVLLGATVSFLCAPAIVRASSIMPVTPIRRVLLPEIVPSQATVFERQYYDALAGAFLRGHGIPTMCDRHPQTLSEAERRVLGAYKHGWLSLDRTEQVRLFYEDR